MGSQEHGEEVTDAAFDRVAETHREFVQSYVGSPQKAKEAIIYSYTRHINGFAAMLEEEEAADIANVVSVFLNKGRKLHTTHSWEFMDLEMNDGVIPSDSLFRKARYGEDTIIANFDTGVWPESPSFSDEGMGPIPSRWKGTCQHDHTGFPCNRQKKKLAFVNVLQVRKMQREDRNISCKCCSCFLSAKSNRTLSTARDYEGHGSHTLSTIGGSFVPGANVFGLGNGTAEGGSPRARVATYKVCWPPIDGNECFDADIMAAFDMAIHDGVDVLSLSAFELHNGQHFKVLFYLCYSSYTLCMRGTIDPEKARGKILVCLRGVTARVEKSLVALKAGAAGMILCNDELSGNELIADPHLLPASQINYEDGLAVYAYMNSTKNPLGYIDPPKTKLQIKPAPSMAAFSSRGPNIVTPEILKPDVTAPGVNIIAAYSEGVSPTDMDFDKRRVPFITMSCPHVAGVVGLLKTLHPDWSPTVIKSALLTTARTRDNTGKPMLDGGNNANATPFAYGSGHIRPNRAMDPGLVYDLTNNDYLNFLCVSGYNHSQIEMFSGAHYRCPDIINILDFNYPTITIPKLYGSVSLTRRVKNVGSPGTYTARLKVPVGLSISVEPNVLKFDNIGEEKSFKLTVEVTRPGVATTFGGITWSDGKHQVRSQIVVGGVRG
ncbi:subtilisin-like protease SBT5.4 [Glycine soja]|uniref:subtilisin-like protease SBT5.4 n=1 Tax=Glycine soja TaxID=3848 RepID=UPI001038EEC6|nr:subtilisin-like protease SBT5.4 [Glycine soja]